MSNELQSYDLMKPQDSLQVANILQDFVKKTRLTTNIKGKEYANVEAWQFAASQLGLMPIVTQVIDKSSDGFIKYEAHANLTRLADGSVVSYGVAICTNKEQNKKFWDEYAICSMAQTRAVGKVCRNLLAWVMKAAGFETTPMEEMDQAIPVQEINDVPTKEERDLLKSLVFTSDLTDEEKESAFEAIDTCSSYKKFQAIEHKLEARQLSIDQIQNPSQKDINKHLKKVVG